MNFKSYFEESIKRNRQFLVEMSLQLTDKNMDFLSDLKRNASFLQFLKSPNGLLTDNQIIGNTEFNVYMYQGGDTINLAYVHEPLVAATIEGEELNNETFQVSYINQFKSYRFLIRDIFINWLSEKYKRIISDNVQTDKAYNFYRNFVIFNNHSTYRVLILNTETGEESEVKNVNEMDKTFGLLPKHSTRRYIIERL